MAVIVGQEDCFVFDFENFTGQETQEQLEKCRDYFETCKPVSGEPRKIVKVFPVQITNTGTTAIVVVCDNAVITFNEPGAPDHIGECSINITNVSLNILGPKNIILMLSESGSLYYMVHLSQDPELLVNTHTKFSSIFYSDVFESLLLNKDRQFIESNLMQPMEKPEASILDEVQNQTVEQNMEGNLKLDDIKNVQVTISPIELKC